MENLLIRVPLDKKELLLTFLKRIGLSFSIEKPDWIEPEPTQDDDMFRDTFGMWADTDITLDSIRKKAWQRG